MMKYIKTINNGYWLAAAINYIGVEYIEAGTYGFFSKGCWAVTADGAIVSGAVDRHDAMKKMFELMETIDNEGFFALHDGYVRLVSGERENVERAKHLCVMGQIGYYKNGTPDIKYVIRVDGCPLEAYDTKARAETRLDALVEYLEAH